MANQIDLNYIYSTIDKIFRHSFGETGDFSGAMYNGDFSLSYDEAQRKKHEYITKALGVVEGNRVIDLGCGWGPYINYLKKVGVKGIGITLSKAQYESCIRNHLEAYLQDCRKVLPADFGMFDGISSVGAFEHFCTPDDFMEGRQDQVYTDFFQHASKLIPTGKRFYLQTMVFGKNMPAGNPGDVNAPKNSDQYIIALMKKQFPGSWLPYGLEQIEKNAKPWFKIVSVNSGRLDYIESIKQWKSKFLAFNLEKYMIYLSLLPRYLRNREFRYRWEILHVSPNRICFEREIMEHYRIVLEKI
ncbi:MAG: class I SAM-dependent methyltransferase [Chitinophagales bacterium]|nr:class I SAM-dependent methyltransferase [Chitinophagales bacterium]